MPVSFPWIENRISKMRAALMVKVRPVLNEGLIIDYNDTGPLGLSQPFASGARNMHGMEGFTIYIEASRQVIINLWAAERLEDGTFAEYKLRDSSGNQYEIDFTPSPADGTPDTYARTFTDIVEYLVIRGANGDAANENNVYIRVK